MGRRLGCLVISTAACLLWASSALSGSADDGHRHMGHSDHSGGMRGSAATSGGSEHEAHAEHGSHGVKGETPYGGVSASEPVGELPKLGAIPPSGKARETGFEGRYHMLSTPADTDPAALCVQGIRGLVMLDNAAWEKCRGKPEGASKGPGYYPAIPPWNTPGTGVTQPHAGHAGH